MALKNKQLIITENLDINNNRIVNLSDPIDNNDAVNRGYLDNALTGITSGSSTLQEAYNNSTSAEILTNSTNGALSIKRGSTADTDKVLEIVNGSNTVTSFIDGGGNSRTNNIVLAKSDTGFAYPELVIEYYNRVNRTVIISGSTLATWRGIPIPELVSGWVSDPHPSGKTTTQFLYYDGTSFVWSDIPWTMDLVLITAAVYVNATIGFIGIRECHGLMDMEAHSIAHTNIGTALKSGGASSGTVLDSISPANRRPIIAALTLKDEDLLTTNLAITNGLYTQLHITGTNTVNVVEGASDIIEVLGTVPYYSLSSGGSFTKTPFPNHGYGSVWRLDVPVTSDVDSQKYRSIFIMPQNVTVGGGSAANTTALATQLALDPATVKLGAFQSTEYRLGWQYVIRYSSTIGSDWAIVGEQAIAGTKGRPSSVQGVNGLTSVAHDTNFNGAGTPTDPLKLADLVTLKPVVANTDYVLQVQNLSGSTTAVINGNGVIIGSNLSGINTGDQPTTAAAINAAAAKPSIVDADEFGIWNSVGGLLAKFTWGNLKTGLSTVFQAIKLTTKGDLLVFNTALDRLPVGANNTVLTADSTVANGVAWKTASAGGHVIKSNGTTIATQPNMNFITNGIGTAIASDDNAQLETEINIRLNSLVDVNPTGVADGNLWKYDAASAKTVPQGTTPFTDVLRSSEVNLSANGVINTYLPADYSILGLRIKGDGTTTAGTLSLGSTSLGSDIGVITLSTTIDTYLVVRKRWFSKSNDTSLYISGISAGTIEIEFILIKGIISESEVILRNYVTPAVATGVLTFNFDSKQECFATKSGGGAIAVNENITVAYSNIANFKTLWTAIEVQTATRTITFPANHKSGDVRWLSLVLTLPVGFYQISVVYNGSFYHVTCSLAEV